MTKRFLCFNMGCVGTMIAGLFGGWNGALSTLCTFMVIDYLLGICCAMFFKNSKKTKSGKLSSKEMIKGIIKKVGELLLVMIAVRLDILTGETYVKDGTIIALVVYETISIIENLGLIGVPIPKIIRRTIDVLREDENNEQ